jgi:hypothetical protein
MTFPKKIFPVIFILLSNLLGTIFIAKSLLTTQLLSLWLALIFVVIGLGVSILLGFAIYLTKDENYTETIESDNVVEMSVNQCNTGDLGYSQGSFLPGQQVYAWTQHPMTGSVGAYTNSVDMTPYIQPVYYPLNTSSTNIM